MPRAGDPFLPAGGIPQSHDPLSRISFQPPDASLDIAALLEMWRQWLLDMAFPLIEEFTGIDLSSPEAFVMSLITVVTTGGPALQFAEALLDLFGNFLGIPNLGSFLPELAGMADRLMNGGQPVNALNLFGSILPGLLTRVPAGGLTTESPNLAPNPNFTSDAIGPSGDWSVDMSVSRTADGTGSGIVIANGMPHAINTGKDRDDRIQVAAGQKIEHRIFAVHASAESDGLGPSVILQVRPFADDTELPLVELDSYTPATPDTEFPGRELKGSYVVAAGVTSVQMRVLLTEHAVSGVWRFDETRISQTADLSTIPGLGGALQALDQADAAIINALSSVARGFPVFGEGIAGLIESFSNFNPLNIAGAFGSPSLPGDFQSFLNMFVGGLRGSPVTQNASVADVYSAASQAVNNIAGSDVTTSYVVTTTVPIEAWCNRVDVVGVGAGGNGLTLGLVGFGADAGRWNAATWIRGTHFTGAVSITITVNSDGSITFAIPGYSITCDDGANATADLGGASGAGAGVYVYNEGNFVGGGPQNAPGGKGIAPGGGGAGGNFFQPGGVGAPGRGWVRQRGSSVPGESTGPDTTGPSLPTVHFHGASNTTVTISATGSVDS